MLQIGDDVDYLLIPREVRLAGGVWRVISKPATKEAEFRERLIQFLEEEGRTLEDVARIIERSTPHPPQPPKKPKEPRVRRRVPQMVTPPPRLVVGTYDSSNASDSELSDFETSRVKGNRPSQGARRVRKMPVSYLGSKFLGSDVESEEDQELVEAFLHRGEKKPSAPPPRRRVNLPVPMFENNLGPQPSKADRWREYVSQVSWGKLKRRVKGWAPRSSSEVGEAQQASTATGRAGALGRSHTAPGDSSGITEDGSAGEPRARWWRPKIKWASLRRHRKEQVPTPAQDPGMPGEGPEEAAENHGPEAAANPRAEAPADHGPELAANPGAEAPADHGPEAAANPRAEAPADHGPEAAANPGAEAPADHGPEAVANPRAEAPADHGPEAAANPWAEAPADHGPEAAANPGAEAPADHGPEAAANPGAEAPADHGPEAAANPGEEAPVDHGPEAAANPWAEAPADHGPEAATNPGAEAPADHGPEAAANPGAEAPADHGPEAATNPGAEAPADHGAAANTRAEAPADHGPEAAANQSTEAPPAHRVKATGNWRVEASGAHRAEAVGNLRVEGPAVQRPGAPPEQREEATAPAGSDAPGARARKQVKTVRFQTPGRFSWFRKRRRAFWHTPRLPTLPKRVPMAGEPRSLRVLRAEARLEAELGEQEEQL